MKKQAPAMIVVTIDNSSYEVYAYGFDRFGIFVIIKHPFFKITVRQPQFKLIAKIK